MNEFFWPHIFKYHNLYIFNIDWRKWTNFVDTIWTFHWRFSFFRCVLILLKVSWFCYRIVLYDLLNHKMNLRTLVWGVWKMRFIQSCANFVSFIENKHICNLSIFEIIFSTVFDILIQIFNSIFFNNFAFFPCTRLALVYFRAGLSRMTFISLYLICITEFQARGGFRLWLSFTSS